MLRVGLYQPEIPPNTGNIIRLCANAGAELHLIHPLGFRLDDSNLRRAGLDYGELAIIKEHNNFTSFRQEFSSSRIFACSTKGTFLYTDIRYDPNDVLLFGPETRGLPTQVLETFAAEQIIRIPMLPNNRSINLSNAVAIILYEAWRQLGFNGRRC